MNMPSEIPDGPSEVWTQILSRTQFKRPELEKQAGSERPRVTNEDRERMDEEVAAFGKIMEGAPVWWQLDGSLNISLRRRYNGGDYIGVHSDVDVSVLREELAEFEEHLKSRGYGLFLRSRDGSMRHFRRVGHAVYKGRRVNGEWEAPYIARINERGEIQTGAGINYIQVMVVDRNEKGDPVERDMTYPQEWLEGTRVEIKGVSIMLSHPARFLLFKVIQMRGYDDDDIKRLGELKVLSKEDIDQVEEIVMTATAKDEWFRKNPTMKQDPERLKRRFDGLRAAVL